MGNKQNKMNTNWNMFTYVAPVFRSENVLLSGVLEKQLQKYISKEGIFKKVAKPSKCLFLDRIFTEL